MIYEIKVQAGINTVTDTIDTIYAKDEQHARNILQYDDRFIGLAHRVKYPILILTELK